MKPNLAHILAACCLLLSLSVAQAAKENFDRSKPHVNIGATINGEDIGTVVSMQGLSIIAPDEKDETGMPRYGDVSISRVYRGEGNIKSWVKATYDGSTCRDCGRDITITVLSRSGEVVEQITLIDAVPTNWDLSTIDDNGGTVLIETFTVSPDRIEFKKA